MGKFNVLRSLVLAALSPACVSQSCTYYGQSELWVLQNPTSSGSQSCTVTCSAAGGTCADGDWGVHSLADINTALSAAGASSCSTYHGAWNFDHRPTVSTTASGQWGPGRCFVNSGGRSICSATYGVEEARLCRCTCDVAPAPPSVQVCPAENTACLNDIECVRVSTALQEDLEAKVSAFSGMEVFREVGAAVDAAADDSGCCDNDLCAELCTLPLAAARAQPHAVRAAPTCRQTG